MSTSINTLPVKRNAVGDQLRNQSVSILEERLGKERLIEDLVKCYEADADDALNAMKTEVISYQGEVTKLVQVPDNATRSRAKERIYAVNKVPLSSREGQQAPGGITLNIIMPDFALPDAPIVLDNGNNTQTLDVTPQEVSDDNKIESLVREE